MWCVRVFADGVCACVDDVIVCGGYVVCGDYVVVCGDDISIDVGDPCDNDGNDIYVNVVEV